MCTDEWCSFANFLASEILVSCSLFRIEIDLCQFCSLLFITYLVVENRPCIDFEAIRKMCLTLIGVAIGIDENP